MNSIPVCFSIRVFTKELRSLFAILHLGNDPMAIEVNGSKLAVRRALASLIEVDIIFP